jgi:hypothetical protein
MFFYLFLKYKMASKTTAGFCRLIYFALFAAVHAFIDIEELESINYGINIVKEPIVIPEVSNLRSGCAFGRLPVVAVFPLL